MLNNTFDLNKSESHSIFGKAIYFSESPNITSLFGKYVCKFSITLKKPILDMNQKITKERARELVSKFNKMFIEYMDVNYDDVSQIGDIFMQDYYTYSKYYEPFIKSMGFNSFKYYSNYYTDFINYKGDYGLCYGIYDTQDITYVDGPF